MPSTATTIFYSLLKPKQTSFFLDILSTFNANWSIKTDWFKKPITLNQIMIFCRHFLLHQKILKISHSSNTDDNCKKLKTTTTSEAWSTEYSTIILLSLHILYTTCKQPQLYVPTIKKFNTKSQFRNIYHPYYGITNTLFLL